MIDTFYVEDEVRDHPRVRRTLERYPDAAVVGCERYGEVFNRRAQDFRLQKAQPSLILAAKHGPGVLPTPEGFGIGSERNYYLSHLLNCPYDCRYCFLQGMLPSAHYVWFVNYEHFESAIAAQIEADRSDVGRSGAGRIDAVSEPSTFFTGYDGDSLAFESVTGFVEAFLPVFARFPEALFELRTKSARMRPLLARPALANTVVAFSLAPSMVAEAVEHRAPSLQARLGALASVAEAGWPIGLRFDPVIPVPRFHDVYREFFAAVADAVGDPRRVHSISLGSMRFPKAMYERLVRLYPDEPLFAAATTLDDGRVDVDPERSAELLAFCDAEIEAHFPETTVGRCAWEVTA